MAGNKDRDKLGSGVTFVPLALRMPIGHVIGAGPRHLLGGFGREPDVAVLASPDLRCHRLAGLQEVLRGKGRLPLKLRENRKRPKQRGHTASGIASAPVFHPASLGLLQHLRGMNGLASRHAFRAHMRPIKLNLQESTLFSDP